jgi:addiction module HigA family antidote
MNSKPKVHPGKVLLDEVMRPLGVSRNKLARDIDVPVGRISAIVSGSRAITADTALRLSKYFGTSAELWMKLQTDYDLAVVRATTWRQTDPRVRVFDTHQGDVAPDAGETPPAAAPAPVAPPTPIVAPVPVAAPPSEPEPLKPAPVEPEPLELTDRVDPTPSDAPRRMARDAPPDEPPVLELTNRVESAKLSPFLARLDKSFKPEYSDEDEPDYETDALDIPERPERP